MGSVSKGGAIVTEGTGTTLLFIDDDVAVQKLMRRVAERAGYRVFQAFDGEEALRVLAEIPLPDLIVLDLMMPKLDGRDLCRRLRADPRTREVPVIILSAKGEQWDRWRGFEAGADDYVDKPFSIEQLMDRIRYQLWKARDRAPKNPAQTG